MSIGLAKMFGPAVGCAPLMVVVGVRESPVSYIRSVGSEMDAAIMGSDVGSPDSDATSVWILLLIWGVAVSLITDWIYWPLEFCSVSTRMSGTTTVV